MSYVNPGQCSVLSDEGLRAECVALSAWEVARAGDITTALLTCETISVSLWRDECFFLLTDVSEIVGPQAVSMCAKAGQFSQRCRGHAFQREAKSILSVGASESPQRQLTVLADLARGYEVERPWWRAHRILVLHLANQDGDFSSARCGDLQRLSCEALLVEMVREVTDQLYPEQWQELCPAPVSGPTANALGVPAWSVEDDAMMQGVFHRICAENLPPRARSSP